MKINEQNYEFIGDALLTVIIRIYLCEKYPILSLGIVGHISHKFVSNKFISELAIFAKISPVNTSCRYADAFEQMLCQIFVEHNFQTAYNWVGNLVKDYKPFHIILKSAIEQAQTLERFKNKNEN